VWLKLRPLLIVIGWGTSIAATVLAGIFQGVLLPAGRGGLLVEVGTTAWEAPLFDLGVFGISVLAGVIIADFGVAVGSFFSSYALAAIQTYTILVLPGYTGGLPVPDALVAAAVVFTFTALFPVILMVGFAGTLLGSALSERFA